MSITDELRREAQGQIRYVYTTEHTKHLLEIADRIDAELAERYVELPKDADGEYIHEHNKVDWRDHAGTWHKNALVVAVCSDGCYVMDGMVFHVHASDIRHAKQPTVEDVLRDFGKAWVEWEDGSPCDPIAQYAAKLRLAGGDE